MGILFTSCTRLDLNENPTIGPSSTNGCTPSKNTQAFIDKKKLNQIEAMLSRGDDENLSQKNLLYLFNEHAQLRQLRSKFDRLSTYLCRRFTSKYTNSIHTRPLTIWMFCDRSKQVNTNRSAIVSSKMFKYIATQVLNEGSQDRFK